ncbi:Efflux pump ustT [Cladobotryum mycophilum]|uniref:Efflux pump ustT n=1 Tax=Cladobotryum mycophilum TaxID=491253 RepID=A0ABR0SWL3_9HYPO
MYSEGQRGSRGASPSPTSRSPHGGSGHMSLDPTERHQADQEDPERVSLLSGSERTLTSDVEGSFRHLRPPSVFAITIAASVLILIVDVVASVPMAPRMVIFEDIICRNYYAAWQDDASMSDCKIEPVQSELAQINAWKETFDTIPGLLVSIPYGALANRIGRNKVLLLALIGCLLSDSWVATVCLFPQTFPLRAIWLSGLFQLIGGGGATVISMCYTSIGDVCSVEERTTAFSQVHAAVLLSELVSIPLGSSLISVNPWIPVLGAIGFMAVATLFAFLFTLNFPSFETTKHSHESDEMSPLVPSAPSSNLRDQLYQTTTKLVDACGWLTKDVLLMLVAFFCCQLSRQFSGVLLQYSSFKFNWEYSKASYLIALGAGVKLLVLIALIPRLTRYFINQRGFHPSKADKYTTIFSGFSLVVGSLFIFLSASPVVLIAGQTFIALGFAFTVTARSFLTGMVDQRHLSLLYTSVTTVTYGGVIVGGPLLAAAFQWGLNLGHFWLGMPFLVTAVLFATATLAVSAAKNSKKCTDR